MRELLSHREINLPKKKERFYRKLKKQVVAASYAAREVTRDTQSTKSGRAKEFLKDEMEIAMLLSRLRDNEIISLSDDLPENCVLIEDPHDYPVLVEMAMIQLLCLSYGKSEVEIKKDYDYDQFAEWFRKRMDYVTHHESQHQLTADEHTSFYPRLGVEFYKIGDEIFIRPFTNLIGTDTAAMYKLILSAPDVLSECDKNMLKKQRKQKTRS